MRLFSSLHPQLSVIPLLGRNTIPSQGQDRARGLGGVKVTRVIHEPGWRWSECVKPAIGTDSCQVGHLIHVISGRIVVRMDDGSEAEFGPGDVGSIPPGHDAWGRWGRTIYQHRLRRCSVRQTAIAESSRWPSARVEDTDAVQRLRKMGGFKSSTSGICVRAAIGSKQNNDQRITRIR